MNRIEKMIERVAGENGGILSCSVAPVCDRNYEKVLHDVRVLVEGGLDQLLIIFYHPETRFSSNMAPAEIIASKRNSMNGTYEDVSFDTAAAIRKQFPDLPLIFSGYVQDMICYGEERFIKKMRDVGIDGFDSPIYRAALDPMGLEEIEEKYGILHIPAYNGSVYKTDSVDKDLLEKTIKVAGNGELFFIPGISGETKEMNGEFFKDEVAALRKIQKKMSLNGALIGISGINTPEDCYQLVNVAGLDGVHFSSAYLKRTFNNEPDDKIIQWLRECKKAMKH